MHTHAPYPRPLQQASHCCPHSHKPQAAACGSCCGSCCNTDTQPTRNPSAPTKCTSRHHATPALRRQNHLHYVTRPAPTEKTGALQRCISAPALWRSARVPPAAAPPSARMCTGDAATLSSGIHKLHHPPAIHPCVPAANGSTHRNGMWPGASFEPRPPGRLGTRRRPLSLLGSLSGTWLCRRVRDHLQLCQHAAADTGSIFWHVPAQLLCPGRVVSDAIEVRC